MPTLIQSFADSVTDVFNRISTKRNTLAASRVRADRISVQDCYECYLTGLGSKIVKTKVGYAMADTLIFEGGKKDEIFYNKFLDRPVKKALRWMAVFGRGIIVIMNSGDNLTRPFDKSKVNEFTQIKVFSGDMVSIVSASRDLTSPRYMKPIMYQVRGHTIHHSRVVDFTYIEPNELELPSYRYGGISEFQFVHNQLKHDGIIERASARIIERNSTLFYMIEGFKESIRNKKDDDVVRYFQLLEDQRSIYGAGLIDKNDDVKSVDQTLSNLAETDQISLRRIAAVTNIPVSELVGENVRGLNSSGDNERSSFHAYIKSWQDDFVYEPLNELTALFGLGEIHFKETQGITSDEQATYEGKIIENAVKLNSMGEDAEAYLADKGIIVIDPIGDFLNFDQEDQEEEAPQEPQPKDILAQFADEFKEGDHPREDNGQFGSGSGKKKEKKEPISESEAFGEAYTECSGKPAEAINKLLKEKNGHVPAAFHKEGIGDIDLVWGNDKCGLKHIINRRNEDGTNGEEFIKKIPSIIESGIVVPDDERNNRSYVVSGNERAVVRLDWDDKKRA